MDYNYTWMCLIGIFVCFVVETVAKEGIIGGEKVPVSHVSYLVSVSAHGKGHICGGGIIGPRHILTAAHCVVDYDGHFDGDFLYILAGTTHLHKIKPPTVIAEVMKISVSNRFNSKDPFTAGDICVLKLKNALDFVNTHKHLTILNLPRRNDRETFVGKTAKIAGFGWDWIAVQGNDEQGSNKDDHLRWAKATVISRKECQSGHTDGIITTQHVCARITQQKNKIRGVCNGDSGGPLVISNTVIGILSSSPDNCTEKISASLYTRVSHYLDWIEHAVADKPHDDIRTNLLYF